MFDGGIFLVLNLKIVAGEDGDWQTGGADGSVFGYEVRGLSHASCSQIIDVLLVNLGHGYYDICIIGI